MSFGLLRKIILVLIVFTMVFSAWVTVKYRRHARLVENYDGDLYSLWYNPEAGVQLFNKNKTSKMYTRNPWLPPFTASFNSEGLRDRDYPKEKPPGAVRIIVLGDSFLFGWGVEQDETFDNRLEEIYAGRKGGPRVEVMNMALPGLNHMSALGLLKGIGLSYNPDIVLALLNNDDIFPDNNNYRAGHMPVLPDGMQDLAVEKDNMKIKIRYINRLRGCGNAEDVRKAGFDRLFETFAERPLREMRALAAQHDFKLVFLSMAPPQTVALYANLAEELGVKIIYMKESDRLRDDLGYGNRLMIIPGDGHPKAEALDLYAHYVAGKLALPETGKTP